ncbi:MAG: hypothetical protein HY331_18335 [Chloroflexi bacterium]|nr:hypothetical protein [Chloroflexota bacterium]
MIPGLDALGLAPRAVRRAWGALGHGAWEIAVMLALWERLVVDEGQWRPHVHGGYKPVAADVTHFLRPRLEDCPTKYYATTQGHTVPAIPVGLIVRVGRVGTQRLGVPVAMVRPAKDNPKREALTLEVARQTTALLKADEVGVFDRAFLISVLQKAGCTRYVTRLFVNFTGQRATVPAYKGTGRRPTRGEVVRPLPRIRNGRLYPATPPDRVETWEEDGVGLRAEWWDDLVLPDAQLPSPHPHFHVVAIYDPRYEEPLLLGTPLEISGAVARALYVDRWPVEQVPLAAKQMVGAARQFVHEPETRQRLPELSLLAGSALSYLAATLPPMPTGSWDRKPRPTPGRLRRVLARAGFPEEFELPERIREKRSATAHLPTGHFGQRRRTVTRSLARASQVSEK